MPSPDYRRLSYGRWREGISHSREKPHRRSVANKRSKVPIGRYARISCGRLKTIEDCDPLIREQSRGGIRSLIALSLGEKCCSNLLGVPSNSLASAGGSRLIVI